MRVGSAHHIWASFVNLRMDHESGSVEHLERTGFLLLDLGIVIDKEQVFRLNQSEVFALSLEMKRMKLSSTYHEGTECERVPSGSPRSSQVEWDPEL